MGKNKKKRNKLYAGPGAVEAKPVITKVVAVNRSKLSQWIFERKAVLKTATKILAVVGVLIFLIFEIVKALNT